jgi:hypothetical protein
VAKNRNAKTRSISRRQLISATQEGGITLVLGAGISMPRGISNWNNLAKAVWTDVFPDRPSPWAGQNQGPSPKEIPQFLPIIFELAHRERKETDFLNILRKHLYAKARLPLDDPEFPKSKESLAVLARLIVAEHTRRPGRRVTSVITFNADDFIEQAVERVAESRHSSGRRWSVVRPVVRSTHSFLGRISHQIIPVYHIHGFLASNVLQGDQGFDERMLVFTDSQYWSTSATAFAFANRIMTSALSEGRCIFIGLSMTDINLLRWLALRTLDRDRDQMDFEQARLLRWLAMRTPEQDNDLLETVQTFLKARSMGPSSALDSHFRRHFWIRPASDDPSGFLGDFLYYRGVQAVGIESWSDSSFQELLTECFPRKSESK